MRRALGLAIAALSGFGAAQQARAPIQVAPTVQQQGQRDKQNGVAVQAPQAAVANMRELKVGAQRHYFRNDFIWTARSKPGRSGGKRSRWNYNR